MRRKGGRHSGWGAEAEVNSVECGGLVRRQACQAGGGLLDSKGPVARLAGWLL